MAMRKGAERGLHVLVVDDEEEDTRELLRTLLEDRGAPVCLAASVAEGLRLLATERPTLVLSDLGGAFLCAQSPVCAPRSSRGQS